MRGKHGARCCCCCYHRRRHVGPPNHCASCKLTRPLRVGHMYSRGWTKVVGDIMEEQTNGRTDGWTHGLSVPHVWTSATQRKPFRAYAYERMDGRTDRSDDVGRPHENPPVRVRLRNKTTAAPARRRQRDRQNTVRSAQPFARESAGAPAGRRADFRAVTIPNDVPDEFRGSPNAKIVPRLGWPRGASDNPPRRWDTITG